jgi:hypothetical protein
MITVTHSKGGFIGAVGCPDGLVVDLMLNKLEEGLGYELLTYAPHGDLVVRNRTLDDVKELGEAIKQLAEAMERGNA